MTNVLNLLEETIASRQAAADVQSSYTARLLTHGVEAIGAKVVEEAGEVVEAAAEQGEPGRLHTIHEAADVVYHLMVLLAARDIRLAEVEQELARRFDISGLQEKAARTSPENQR